MLGPLLPVLFVLMFAGPVALAARPLTPVRFISTITVIGAGWFASGSYWGVFGAFIFSAVVVIGSLIWFAIRWQLDQRP